MSYDYTATDVVSLAKIYAFGGSDEIAYPDGDAAWYSALNTIYRSKVLPRVIRKGGANWHYKVASWTMTASQATYDITGTAVVGDGDFHRMRRLVIEWDTYDQEDVVPLEERERARMQVAAWGRYERKGYVLRNGVLELIPTPTSAETCSVVYQPTAPDLTYSTATISGPEGLDEVLALELAVRMRGAQNEDTRDQRMDLQSAYEALDEAAGQQRQDEPPRIIDTHPEGYGDPMSDWAHYREPRA